MTTSPTTEQDDALACLDRALKTPSRHHERQREEYLQRLSSFCTPTYFAKPASLSPIVCARFGWQNVDENLLCCVKCQAVVAVTFMRGLSAFATDKLTCRYEQQLASEHKGTCIFRRDAMEYFKKEKKEQPEEDTKDVIIPLAFTSYFPADLVDLVESKRPAIVLGRQLKERLEADIAWESIRLDYHASLLQYQPPTNATAEQTDVSLANGLVNALSQAGYSFKDDKKAKTAALLLLLGWKPNECVGVKEEASISFSCALCRVTVDVLVNNHDKETDATEPQAKRLRPSGWDPLYAHRHYCPFVCGFPRHGASMGTPIWQALADKVLTTSSLSLPSNDETSLPNLEGKSQWEQVNALLNAAIVRTRPLVDSK